MTPFEREVAEALIQYATDWGRVEIGVMEDHITSLARPVAAAIQAAASKAWMALPAYYVVGSSPTMDYPARQAALDALRGPVPLVRPSARDPGGPSGLTPHD